MENMDYGIFGALSLFIVLLLLLYRLHKKETGLIASAGFVSADTVDTDASSAAERFVGRETTSTYAYTGTRHNPGTVYLFKHAPSGDEPSITSLVIETDAIFEKSAVIYKVYGSHLLIRAFKKMLIKTGDLGIEGKSLDELDSFNAENSERYGLFAMGEPGFDTQNPVFIKLAGILRGLDRKTVAGIGISGRHILAWSSETGTLLRLGGELQDASG